MNQKNFNENFLKLLVCPKDGSKLKYNKNKNILVSENGKSSYSIESGIPKLILEQDDS
tara:strand:+ start:823 stop:996 length:174 start_codon:yes stop_codon:yes gene_type:complete